MRPGYPYMSIIALPDLFKHARLRDCALPLIYAQGWASGLNQLDLTISASLCEPGSVLLQRRCLAAHSLREAGANNSEAGSNKR